MVEIACGAFHSIAVVDNGLVYTWGANDHYQIGHDDGQDSESPRLLTQFVRPMVQWDSVSASASAERFEMESVDLPWIVSASCGDNHTAFLSAKGVIFVCGDNRFPLHIRRRFRPVHISVDVFVCVCVRARARTYENIVSSIEQTTNKNLQ